MRNEVNMLCVSDIHGRTESVKALTASIGQDILRSLDAIIIAGDLGNPQKEEAFIQVIGELSKLGKPVLYIRGNWDANAPSGIVNEEPLIADLEALGPLELNGMLLIGHGASLKPFKGLFSKPIILVTHYPPFSILDRGGKLEASLISHHAGLPEVNYLLSYYKPIVHIFGHSHALGGIHVKYNGVTYINVARLDRVDRDGKIIGNYAIVNVNKEGGVSVEWRFIGGVWKKCNRCGKKVHLPGDWTMCRRCANRFDLGFQRVSRDSEKTHVIISDTNKEMLNETFYVPVSTLRNEESYEDFVEYILLRRLKEVIEQDGRKVVVLPKDRVAEYYSEGASSLVAFSEYLFACKSEKVGEKVCSLMKMYALDKKAQVMWVIKKDGGRAYIEKEIVFVNDKLLSSKGLLEELIYHGFQPLVYRIEVFTTSNNAQEGGTTSIKPA
ncbi:MAG: metallophosphoesterase [Thermofilaceae archaeon]